MSPFPVFNSQQSAGFIVMKFISSIPNPPSTINSHEFILEVKFHIMLNNDFSQTNAPECLEHTPAYTHEHYLILALSPISVQVFLEMAEFSP